MHVLHPRPMPLPDTRATLAAAAVALAAAAGLVWAEPIGSGSDAPPAAEPAPAPVTAPAAPGAPVWRVNPLEPVRLSAGGGGT
jgi:hypothetical protein